MEGNAPKTMFIRGLNRSVPFHFTGHFSEPSTFRNGTERNVSSRSRVNNCKNSFVFWNSSISFRSVSFRSRVNGAYTTLQMRYHGERKTMTTPWPIAGIPRKYKPLISSCGGALDLIFFIFGSLFAFVFNLF